MPKISDEPGKRQLTPLQAHVKQWGSCTLCDLCKTRKNVVLGKGKFPCDILLTGEGPGFSEDILAKPFEGPAGHLLDYIVERALICSDIIDADKLRVGFSNIVACIPVTYEEGKPETQQPPAYAVEACAPRIQQLVDIGQPRLIVAVGAFAKGYIATEADMEKLKVQALKMSSTRSKKPPPFRWSVTKHSATVIDIIHPAAIKRANVSAQGLMTQKAIVALAEAITEVFA